MDRKSNSFKGFTLIELVVVIAIIGILAGIMSVVMNGFARDNRLETNNAKAKVIYDAFQDILIDCEVKQDLSMLEVWTGHAGKMKGTIVFFRISDTDIAGNSYEDGKMNIGDEIHIMNVYDTHDTSDLTYLEPNHISSGSIINRNTDTAVKATIGGALHDDEQSYKMWDRLSAAVSGRIDKSMEGTYVVMIDYENYQVMSVIYRELVNGKDPKSGLYDVTEVNAAGEVALGNYLPAINSGFPCQVFFVKNIKQQENISKGQKSDGSYDRGVYIGCYPFYDDVYDGDTYPTIPNAS